MSHENTNADNRDSGSVTDGHMHARDVRHLRDGGGTGGEPMRYIGPALEFVAIVGVAVLFWLAVVS